MRVRAILLAAALVLAPLGARAADLVVWWEDEFSPGEDDAVREMMAAFEQKTGKTVELTFLPQDVLPGKLQGAVDAGEPPDFEFGTTTNSLVPRWAREGRLVELSAALGPLTELIDKDALAWATLPGGADRARGPLRHAPGPLHAPRPRVEEPAGARRLHARGHPEGVGAVLVLLVRQGPAGGPKATGRDDIFGIGLAMSRDGERHA